MIYLLDTNIWIEVLRKPSSALATRFRAMVPSDIRICSIVVSELRHGCLRSAKPAENRIPLWSMPCLLLMSACPLTTMQPIISLQSDIISNKPDS